MQVRRRKGTAGTLGGRVFIDLESCDVRDDIAGGSVIVAAPTLPADAESVCARIGGGPILVVDLSRFEGDFEERGTFMETLRTRSRSQNCALSVAGQICIITPAGMPVRKI